jgi:hypothetical protein
LGHHGADRLGLGQGLAAALFQLARSRLLGSTFGFTPGLLGLLRGLMFGGLLRRCVAHGWGGRFFGRRWRHIGGRGSCAAGARQRGFALGTGAGLGGLPCQARFLGGAGFGLLTLAALARQRLFFLAQALGL